jgi:hypothetical protein
MIVWSVSVGVLGICGTGLWLMARSRQQDHGHPLRVWGLGLGAVLPAWLLAFLGLFAAPTGQSAVAVTLPPAAIWSSGVGLLGVVATDAAVRRLHAAGRLNGGALSWLLGVVALLPGWGVALFGLLRR